MGDWVVTFDGLDPALVRADSRDHAIRAACALCGSEAVAAEADIRARRARGDDGRYPVVEVHDWHRTDEAISACGLPAGEVVRAWGEGQATCPACLEVLREERLEATAAAVTRVVMECLREQAEKCGRRRAGRATVGAR